MARVSLIAAIAEGGVIGRDGALPWHLPEDLRRFRALTDGHHLIVGRATWESIGRPLPGRRFLVVTRHPERIDGPSAPSVAAAVEQALAAGDPEPFVAGGAGIYREGIERGLVDRMHLTRIHRAYDGDTRFPAWDAGAWRLVESRKVAADPQTGAPAFDFEVWDRRVETAEPGSPGSPTADDRGAG